MMSDGDEVDEILKKKIRSLIMRNDGFNMRPVMMMLMRFRRRMIQLLIMRNDDSNMQ